MHKIKQNGRRWLSGFLALVMAVGLFPTVGLVTTAHAAGGAPPDTIYIEKADYDNIESAHSKTANKKMGFCA